MRADAGVWTGTDWREALEGTLRQMPFLEGGAENDLVLLFASDAYGEELPALVAETRRRTRARLLIGCSSQGVIGPGREIENEPGIALQAFSLPGATLTPSRLTAEDIASGRMARVWTDKLGHLAPADVNAWLFFIDPFTLDGESLLSLLGTVNRGVPLVGGLASGDYRRRRTYVFLNDEVFEDGAVGVALGGAFTVRTVVSQGAAPIGETWTITEAEGNVIHSIGNRPALEVLYDTFRDLDPETQQRAQANLLVGLAMNEYRDEFQRGDFLIRNLVGVDQASGAIVVGAIPRVGQTIQFQLRDPAAADEDLHALLSRTKLELEGVEPVGALLCSCNGRGAGLFGTPDHDARTLAELLGPVPVAGFFCNGEIGPVGGENYLHGFTASIALIVPKTD